MQIKSDGTVEPGEGARDDLGACAGEWQLLCNGGDILILGRAGQYERLGQGAALVGSIDGPDTLPGIINFLAMGQESGALHVTDGSSVFTLFLYKGKLLSAASSREQHRLGRLLVRQRLITAEQAETCLAEAATEADRFGRALLRRGLLTTHQIYEAIKRQSQEIFSACLAVTRGLYYLVKPIDMSQVPAMLHLDIQGLLLDGLRRSDELQHLRAIVPDPDAVLVPTRVAASRELSETAANLHARLDGETPLSSAIEMLGVDELTGTRAAAELIKEGSAEILSQQALLRARPPESQERRAEAAETIIDVYREATRLVLASQPPAMRYEHENNLSLFVKTAEAYADILCGVELTPEGDLDRSALVANVCAQTDEGNALDHLQHCLHELLFFLLFEVGHKSERDNMDRLHREVGAVLAKLPGRLANLRPVAAAV